MSKDLEILKTKRILIVDDALDIQLILKNHLQTFFMEVDVAGTYSLALEKVKTNSYDLVLLDIRMGGASGFEIAPQLRSQGCRAPIYAFSSLSESYFDRLSLAESGFSGFLSKDFTINPLESLPAKLSETISKSNALSTSSSN